MWGDMAVTAREGAAAEEQSTAPLEDLVVITGFSGAGKSTAMNAFEDAGYFCVDNLPPEMIGRLVELFRLPGSKVRRAAVVCDVRGGEFFAGPLAVLDGVGAGGMSGRVLLLAPGASP